MSIKSFMSVLLATLLLFSLCACGATNTLEDAVNPTLNENESEESPEEPEVSQPEERWPVTVDLPPAIIPEEIAVNYGYAWSNDAYTKDIKMDLCDITDNISEAGTLIPVYKEVYPYLEANMAKDGERHGIQTDDYYGFLDCLEADFIEFCELGGIDCAGLRPVTDYLEPEFARYQVYFENNYISSGLGKISVHGGLREFGSAEPDTLLDVMKENDSFKAALSYTGITDPSVEYRRSTSSDGETSTIYVIYQNSSDPIEEMANKAFRSITLGKAGDSVYMYVQKDNAVNIAESYELIGYDKAVERLYDVYGIEEDRIASYDIQYSNKLCFGYYIPCYRFVIERGFSYETDGQTYTQYSDLLVHAIDNVNTERTDVPLDPDEMMGSAYAK